MNARSQTHSEAEREVTEGQRSAMERTSVQENQFPIFSYHKPLISLIPAKQKFAKIWRTQIHATCKALISLERSREGSADIWRKFGDPNFCGRRPAAGFRSGEDKCASQGVDIAGGVDG